MTLKSKKVARRLSVVELERAMGFPDNYTRVVHKESVSSDTMRRQALGNSFAVPVVRWIGERINFIHNIKEAENGESRYDRRSSKELV